MDTQANLFDKDDWRNHWVGMPEFVQEQKREYAKLIIRFRNEEDLQKFAALIGQSLNRKSQCTWYPELVSNKNLVRKYIDES